MKGRFYQANLKSDFNVYNIVLSLRTIRILVLENNYSSSFRPCKLYTVHQGRF